MNINSIKKLHNLLSINIIVVIYGILSFTIEVLSLLFFDCLHEYNPWAGKGKIKYQLSNIIELLNKKFELIVYSTKCKNDTRYDLGGYLDIGLYDTM